MPAAATIDDAIGPLVADKARVAVLLDVDGTLAPIVRDPEAATVPELTRRLVMRIINEYGFVGCVSGRRASVARRILGIGSIPYAGLHGVELLPRGAGEALVDTGAARWSANVHAVVDAAGAERMRAAGLRREDKGPIVALHWRGADDEHGAQRLALELAADARRAGLAVHEGRSVLELRPPVPIGKDSAVRRLLDGVDVDLALYAGDDRTDLDAFAGLRGLVDERRLRAAVCVGVVSDQTPDELRSGADLLVTGTDGVRELLGALVR